MRRRCSGSAAARACPQPRVQEEGNGLRNPRVAGQPATHRPFVHAQAPGSLHLAQAQAAEGIAELLRRHGHNAVGKVPVARSQGKLPQPPAGSALSNRAICPRLPVRCLIISQIRRDGTSAGRSDYWRSSRTTCGSPTRASWRATITLVWSWRHGTDCGLLRQPFGPSALGMAFYRSLCSSVGSRLEGSSWPPSALRSWCVWSRDPCEASSGWCSRCERSNTLPELSQEAGSDGGELGCLCRRQVP